MPNVQVSDLWTLDNKMVLLDYLIKNKWAKYQTKSFILNVQS